LLDWYDREREAKVRSQGQTEAVIELDHVTITLSGEEILKDVSLTVYAGEVLVIIGPSGSGKTVLLKTMAGLIAPTSGEVRCYHSDLNKLTSEQRHDLARKIGMQFQRSALFDDLTAYENIAFVLHEHTPMTEDEIHLRARECLAAVALEKYENFHEYEMSGGMKQRLGIARAVALKPEILFMDDPTAGLDPVNADNIADLILNLKRQMNATLVVVTHDILRAYQFAGRIVFVVDQTVLDAGGGEAIRHHPDPRVQQFIHGDLIGPLTQGREL
jgi:phospholipid/cholesterol/gamma-HCH transport system ATP-binding protein